MVYRESPSPPGTCPRCREALLGLKRGYGKIEVNSLPNVRWCEKCGGVMADVTASARIVTTLDRDLIEIGFQAGRGHAPKRDEGRTLSCPECQFAMVRTRIESANCVVDACPTHGTWFDAGELEAVTRAFAHARRSGVVARGVSKAPSPPEAASPPLPPPDEGSLREWVRSLFDTDD